MKKFIDISMPIEEGMVVWPGDIHFVRKELRGTSVNSNLTISTHTGTHIDAPKHFLFNNNSVDKISLDKLVGKVRVVEISKNVKKFIEIKDLPKNIRPREKILFKTRNSLLLRKKQFDTDYVSLSLPAAKVLATAKIDLVGIDYYGIEAKSAPGHPVHKTLLRAGIAIVEGVDLAKVKHGIYHLTVLPLKLVGADGSPARAILQK